METKENWPPPTHWKGARENRINTEREWIHSLYCNFLESLLWLWCPVYVGSCKVKNNQEREKKDIFSFFFPVITTCQKNHLDRIIFSEVKPSFSLFFVYIISSSYSSDRYFSRSPKFYFVSRADQFSIK
jgi:hypothetical protein